VENALFQVVARPSETQISKVTFALRYGATVAPAGEAFWPSLRAELRAPSVASDTLIALEAQAYDAAGVAVGEPVSLPLLVTEDLGAAPQFVLDGLPTGTVVGGSILRIQASPIGEPQLAEVRFSLDGGPAISVPLWPWSAELRVPSVVSPRLVPLVVTAIDAQGRTTEQAASIEVVPDTGALDVDFRVEPASGEVQAGTTLSGIVSALAGRSLAWSTVTVAIGGEAMSSGLGSLSWTVPAATVPGTVVELIGRAGDWAGRTVEKRARFVVREPSFAGAAVVASADFAGSGAMAVLGDRIFVATPRGLEIGRIVRGATPSVEHLSSYATAAPVRDVAVLGDLAVVALGAGGLEVLDVSGTGAPTLRGRMAGAFHRVVATPRGFYVDPAEGSQLYQYLHALQVDDPSRPALGPILAYYMWLLGASDTGPLYGNGNSLYWLRADGSATYTAVDSPTLAAADEDALLAVSGTTLTVATFSSSVSGAQRVGALSLPASAGSIAVADGRAYLGCADGQLRVVDVREPRTPRIVGALPLEARALAVSGGVLIASTADGLVLRELGAAGGASGPTLVATTTIPAGTVWPSVTPRLLAPLHRSVLLAGDATGLKLADPFTETLSVSTVATGTVRGVATVGRRIFQLDAAGKIYQRLETVGTASAPAFESNAPQLGKLLDGNTSFAVSPTRLWAIAGTLVRTAVLPDAPAKLELGLPTTAYDVDGDERRAMVALGGGGLTLVGLNAAGELTVQSNRTDLDASAVSLFGDLGVAAGATRLATYDLSTGTLLERGTAPLAGRALRVRLSGRLAVVSEGASGVELWDLSNVELPARVAQFGAAESLTDARDALLTGDRLLVADGQRMISLPLPELRVDPAVRLRLPADGMTVAAGGVLTIAGQASGPGLDDAELLVNGKAVARVDDGALRTTWPDASGPGISWTVPPSATIGETPTVQLMVRATGGRAATSAMRTIRVVAPTTGAPTLSCTAPAASFLSADDLTLTCTRSGGIGPFVVEAAFVVPGTPETTFGLGRLDPAPDDAEKYVDTLRLPSFNVATAGSILVQLTDGAGRQAPKSYATTIRANGGAPTTPSGLPTEGTLYAGTPGKTVTLVSTDADGGPFTIQLWLESGGLWSLVGESDVREATGSTSLSYASPAVVLPYSLVGQTVRLRAVAVDASGLASAPAEATYQVIERPDQPTTFTWSPSGTLVTGYRERICVSGTDADGASSQILKIDGVVAGGFSIPCSGITNGTCVQTCAEIVVPAKSALPVSASLTDGMGRVSATPAKSFTVAANQAPTLSLTVPAYAIAGTPAKIDMYSTDERTPVGRTRVTAQGTVGPAVDLFDAPYVSNAWIYPSYVAPAEERGPVSITLESTDLAGFTASLTKSIARVLPPDTSLVCATPLILNPEGETAVLGQTLKESRTVWAPVAGNTGAWVGFPYEGPIVGLEFDITWALTPVPCDSATAYASGSPKRFENVDKDARMIVYTFGNKLTVNAARLGEGAKCDPASAKVKCAYGAACGVDGRCHLPACSNLTDDDGDGRGEWPTDPGCSWPGDDDETDPVPAPACATAYSTTPDCGGAAAGDSTAFCSVAKLAGALGGQPLPLTVYGSTVGASSAFTLTTGSDRVYQWRAPFTGNFHATVAARLATGTTAGASTPATLSVRTGRCDGTAVVTAPNAVDFDAVAGAFYAIVVDAAQPIDLTLQLSANSGTLPLGWECDPDSTAAVCQAGSSCQPSGAGNTCQEGAYCAVAPDLDLTGMALPVSVSESTYDGSEAGTTDFATASCVPAGVPGSDDVYTWTSPGQAGTYRFAVRATDSMAVPVISVRAGNCAGDELACGAAGVTTLSLDPNTKVAIIVDGATAASFHYDLLLSPVVPTGGACDPSWGVDMCVDAAACIGSGATGTCQVTACTDTLDNDGDGAIDAGGATPDPNCETKATPSEAFCPPRPADPPPPIALDMPILANLSGNQLVDSGCGGVSTGGEYAFSFTAPSAGYYRFATTTAGIPIPTVVYLRKANCLGTELACGEDPGGGFAETYATLVAGQTIAVVVDSKASAPPGPVFLTISKL
jgi:hypothetical protein